MKGTVTRFTSARHIRTSAREKIVSLVLRITAGIGGASYTFANRLKDRTMSLASRIPDNPTTRLVVEWRRRIPSHELIMLGMPELADFPMRKTDRRAEAGKWFWQS